MMCDKSGYFIKVSFWNEIAAQLDHKCFTPNGQFIPIVIECHNIKVSSYGGLSLNCHEDSYVKFSPQSKKANKLIKWYSKLVQNR